MTFLCMKNKRAGFTLVELLVVLAIIAVIAAFAIPIMSKFPSNYRLRSEARYLLVSFQKARMEAARTSRPVLLSFDTVNNKYDIFKDTNENGSMDAGELIETHVMPDGVDLFSASFSGATTIAGYNSRGLSYNNREGNVQLKNDNSLAYKLTLTPAGNVRLDNIS